MQPADAQRERIARAHLLGPAARALPALIGRARGGEVVVHRVRDPERVEPDRARVLGALGQLGAERAQRRGRDRRAGGSAARAPRARAPRRRRARGSAARARAARPPRARPRRAPRSRAGTARRRPGGRARPRARARRRRRCGPARRARGSAARRAPDSGVQLRDPRRAGRAARRSPVYRRSRSAPGSGTRPPRGRSRSARCGPRSRASARAVSPALAASHAPITASWSRARTIEIVPIAPARKQRDEHERRALHDADRGSGSSVTRSASAPSSLAARREHAAPRPAQRRLRARERAREQVVGALDQREVEVEPRGGVGVRRRARRAARARERALRGSSAFQPTTSASAVAT